MSEGRTPDGRHRSDRRTRHAVLCTCIAALCLPVGCAGPTHDALRPVPDGDASGPPGAARGSALPPTSGPTPTDTTPTSEPTADVAAAGGGSDRAASLHVVDDALGRYDRSLTALLRDPGALDRPDSPTVTAWRATVAAGAILADDIAADVAARRSAGQVVVAPDGIDRSYVHRATDVDGGQAGDPTGIRFTWCGWSPGIVRDAASGAILDDRVAHATGSGVLQQVGPTWVLASLDEATLEVLPAGSADPCPGGRR